MQKEQEATIYQLKVGIAGAKPPIWRRVLVPADYTLADLHPVMQALMGWDDDHLHQFEVPGPGQTDVKTLCSRENSQFYGPANAPDGSPLDWLSEDESEEDESEDDFLDFDWLIDRSLKDEAKPVLKEIAPAVKFHFCYIYDMGDNWVHDILVEKILPADPEGIYPICVTGKRNSPLEDTGGIWGYEEMLEVLADPKHEDYADRKEWLEAVYDVDTWDGAEFDLEEINQRLETLCPKAKPQQAARRRS